MKHLGAKCINIIQQIFTQLEPAIVFVLFRIVSLATRAEQPTIFIFQIFSTDRSDKFIFQFILLFSN